MTGEKGFALLTALWLIAALTSVVGLGLATTRLGQQTTINRITLTRGRWAAEACLSIVQRRWVERRLSDTATIDLGRGTRCSWSLDDPGARINVNVAEREVLALLTDSARAAHLVDARRVAPFLSVGQLPQDLQSLLTVEGPGTVNLSSASPRVLGALPGIRGEAVERIVSRRALGRPIASLDELAGLLSPPAHAALLARYADLARLAVFAPSRLVITAQGWVETRAPRATIELVIVPLPERLATVRRRMW